MPIHEYVCDSCGASAERLEFRSDVEPPLKCCGVPMRRCVSAQLHILKGTGFYATEWGLKQHHLKPRDQAIRAAREVKERDLHPALPHHVTCDERKAIDKIAERRG